MFGEWTAALAPAALAQAALAQTALAPTAFIPTAHNSVQPCCAQGVRMPYIIQKYRAVFAAQLDASAGARGSGGAGKACGPRLCCVFWPGTGLRSSNALVPFPARETGKTAGNRRVIVSRVAQKILANGDVR